MVNLTHIAFETTDCCNLNCTYCYNIWKSGKYNNIHTPFNSYKKAIAALEKLFEQATIEYVAFTGGEPFLAERYAEVILFCRMEGKHAATRWNYLHLPKNCATLLPQPIAKHLNRG